MKFSSCDHIIRIILSIKTSYCNNMMMICEDDDDKNDDDTLFHLDFSARSIVVVFKVLLQRR